MTNYIDTYIKCSDLKTLQDFIITNGFGNVIQPEAGRAAYPFTDPNGTTTQIAAVGDPAFYYACIRAGYDMSPIVAAQATEASATGTPVITVCDTATGHSVLGVWAH